jgi:hypothetical protein
LRLGARAFIRKPENKAQWDELKRTVSENLPKPAELSSTLLCRLGRARPENDPSVRFGGGEDDGGTATEETRPRERIV